MYMSYLTYSFICQWTLGLFPLVAVVKTVIFCFFLFFVLFLIVATLMGMRCYLIVVLLHSVFLPYSQEYPIWKIVFGNTEKWKISRSAPPVSKVNN